MKRSASFFLLGVCAMAMPFTMATAGVDDIAKKCATCHGDNGNSSHQEVPNIGGMSKAYLNDTMQAYKAGDRPGKKFKPENGEETDMNEVAKKLSDEDIEAIAAFYAGKKYVPHEQEVDAKLAAVGKKLFTKYCEKCHSKGGTVADDDAALLAGQWKPYLKHEFELFSSGEREMPKKMRKRYEKLDEKKIEAIIEYLAGGSK